MWLYSPAHSDLYYYLWSPYTVPGKKCDLCGAWGGHRFRQFLCPTQIREEVEAVYKMNPSRPVAEWEECVRRWEAIIAKEAGSECLLTPGDSFQPMRFRIHRPAREAWYISDGAAVLSNKVADAIRESAATGVQLFELGEFLQYEDIHLEIPLPVHKQRSKGSYGYVGAVVLQDNWTTIFRYKELEQCPSCGRVRDTSCIGYSDVCEEVAVLREAGQIWEEIVLPDLDIFTYQDDWVVSDRVHSVLKRFLSSEIAIKPLVVV